MPNTAVVDMAGNNVGEIALNDAVFGIAPNVTVMHMAVVSRGGRRAPATQGRARQELRSGDTAAWCTPPSRGITPITSTRR